MSDKSGKRLISIEEARELVTSHNLEVMSTIDSTLEELASRAIDFEQRDSSIRSRIRMIQYIMAGIIITFFVAFLAFVFDAYHYHTITYEDFSKTIESIHHDRQEDLNRRVSTLKNEVDALWVIRGSFTNEIQGEQLTLISAQIDCLNVLIRELNANMPSKSTKK